MNRYAIQLRYDGGVVTVGREETLSLAITYALNLVKFVNDDVILIRVYDNQSMKQRYGLQRYENGWKEVA